MDKMEQAMLGNLAQLTPEQRTTYYMEVCESLGLNPLTKPFQYVTLNGRLVLYATRDGTDQLRKVHGITVHITTRERLDDLYIVTAKARDRSGREDESTGVVAIAGLKGDLLANALMKAETKAKRRVTLSLVGLGWLDETEIETIPEAKSMIVDNQREVMKALPAATVEAPAATIGTHWIDNEKVRKRFWAWIGAQGLSKTDVHEALGVANVTEFGGTAQDAKERILAWIAAKSATDEALLNTGDELSS